MLTSTRYQIPYPDPARTDTADVPRDIGSVVTAVEKSMIYLQGTIATRPAAAVQGRMHFASDTGQFSYDTGSTWTEPGSVHVGSMSFMGGTSQLLFPSQNASSNSWLASKLGTDTQYRFAVWADGTMNWGPGGVTAADTNLRRSAVNQLTVSGTTIIQGQVYSQSTAAGSGFVFNPSTAAGSVLYAAVQGEANPRYTIAYDGTHAWGPGGAAAQDTTLSRLSAGQLAVGSTTQAGSLHTFATSGVVAYRIRIGADANSTYAVWGNGIISWGAGGATVQDVQIVRGGAGLLQVQTFGAGAAGAAAVLQADHRTYVASVITARVGGAAAALPANPVRYLAFQDENGNRMYVPAYS